MITIKRLPLHLLITLLAACMPHDISLDIPADWTYVSFIPHDFLVDHPEEKKFYNFPDLQLPVPPENCAWDVRGPSVNPCSNKKPETPIGFDLYSEFHFPDYKQCAIQYGSLEKKFQGNLVRDGSITCSDFLNAPRAYFLNRTEGNFVIIPDPRISENQDLLIQLSLLNAVVK